MTSLLLSSFRKNETCFSFSLHSFTLNAKPVTICASPHFLYICYKYRPSYEVLSKDLNYPSIMCIFWAKSLTAMSDKNIS